MSTTTAHLKPREDEIDVYGLTHPGTVRTTNQDHFLVASLGTHLAVRHTSLPSVPDTPIVAGLPPGERIGFLAMVADGVGSSVWGEEASRIAVEAITLYVARSVQAYYAADDAALAAALQSAAQDVHAELVNRAQSSERKGMATTLTLWLGVWPRVYVLQVGDSRCYRYSEGQLLQVSRDQTVAQELIDSGVLSLADAARTRWTHVLSSSIGGPATQPVVTPMQNDRNTVHLLCSDGLTKHVSDDRIRERLAGMTSAKEVCEQLLQDALDDGGTDNITIIVGRARPSTAG